jgi:hypothetical protein
VEGVIGLESVERVDGKWGRRRISRGGAL